MYMKTLVFLIAALSAAVTPVFAQWSVQYMSQPRYNMATARFPAHAIFVSDSWDRYDVSTDTWSNGVLSDARLEISVAQAGTKAYFGGGKKGPFTDPIYVKAIDIYNDATNTWSKANLLIPDHLLVMHLWGILDSNFEY